MSLSLFRCKIFFRQLVSLCVCIFINYILHFFLSHLIFKNIDQVHPGSFSVDGMLGNMRFCDMSLGPDHRWGWLCDIRKPGVESLIKVSSTSPTVSVKYIS